MLIRDSEQFMSLSSSKKYEYETIGHVPVHKN
jgi:hypothetical protein